MSTPRLDHLIRRSQKASLPSPPANLRENVWREIRMRAPESHFIFNFDAFMNWFYDRQSVLTLSFAAVAAVVSVGFTMAVNLPTGEQRAQQALGLDVFSHQSSPLTRLADNP